MSDDAAAQTPPSVIIPKRGRKLAAVASTLWLDNTETGVLNALSPVIVAALAIPVSAIGILVSVSKVIGMVFGPFWAWLARKTDRKLVLVIETAAVAVLTAAAGLSQDFAQLLIIWSLAAVFVAASLPLVSEITADLYDEKSRGRANGNLYGFLALAGSVLGPVIGQLSRVPDGWRYGFFGAGAIGLVLTVWIALGFKDPGVGASEPSLASLTREQRDEQSKLTWAKLRYLMTIPTLVVMLGQRLFSGHLLVGTFAVLFLVQTYGFDNASAVLVLLPYGIGYFVGTFVGGFVTDALNTRSPRYGRVGLLQFAQLAFGVLAIVATQVDWGSIGLFALFFGLMALVQGINPGVNRPIVMAVVPPELRGAAFALMLSVFEALAFVLYNLVAGFLADAVGLQAVFLWIPGVLMILNGLYCTLLYRTYPRDVVKLAALLEARSEAGARAQGADPATTPPQGRRERAGN